MLKAIKVRLEGAKGAWPKELPSFLWVYRTTTGTPIRKMPFNLTYGTEVVILVEVRVTSIRKEFFNEETNNDQLRMNLDCLDKTRDEASKRMPRYQQKMAGYNDHRVKLKKIQCRRPCLMKGYACEEGPNSRKVRTNLGRPLQSHSLLETRKLPPKVHA